MFSLFIGIFSIAMIMTACTKEEETITPTPTPTPTPTNLKNYVGATAVYGQPVSFTTGEINGEIWLVSYAITAKYVDTTQSQTYIQNYSLYISSGIKKFTSNAIEIDTGTDLTYTATLKEDGKYLEGNYIYNYTGSLTHTADFATDRE